MCENKDSNHKSGKKQPFVADIFEERTSLKKRLSDMKARVSGNFAKTNITDRGKKIEESL